MRLLLVRHAETDANVTETLQGHAPNPLSARGLRQAALIGHRLKHHPFDIVFSSDLERARQTTLAITQGREVPVHYDLRLRERSYGVFQGRPVTEFQNAFTLARLAREEFRPEGGESYRDVDARIREFLKEITNQYQHATILIVSHSGTNRILLRALLKTTFAEAFCIEQENTCVNELIVSGSEVSVLTMNCVSHLRNETFVRLGVGE